MPNPSSKINGRSYQHGTIAMSIAELGGSFAIETFSDIAYGVGAEKKPVMDSKGKVIGYTIDAEKNDGCSVTVLQAEWRALKAQFAQQYPNLGIGQVPFDWVVTYGATKASLMTDNLEGVMFQKEARKSSKDQEALYVELPLFIARIHMDGGDFINYDAVAQ